MNKTKRQFQVGDTVEVLDESLAMLRRLCPNQPPNNIGVISEFVANGDALVEFKLSGENHSQVAPYPVSMLVLKKEAKRTP